MLFIPIVSNILPFMLKAKSKNILVVKQKQNANTELTTDRMINYLNNPIFLIDFLKICLNT